MAHRCESAIREKNGDQIPIYESFGGFNTFGQFLAPNALSSRDGSLTPGVTDFSGSSYLLTYRLETWQINVGLLHGLDLSFDQKAEFAIYDDSSPRVLLGRVLAKEIQLEYVEVTVGPDLSSTLSTWKAYVAIPIFLPIKPFLIGLKGSSPGNIPGDLQHLFQNPNQEMQTLTNMVDWVDEQTAPLYCLDITPQTYQLQWQDTGIPVFPEPLPRDLADTGGKSMNANVLEHLLRHVIHWERFFDLDTQHSSLKDQAEQVAFKLTVFQENGDVYTETESNLTLDFLPDQGRNFKITFSNRSDTKLYAYLYYMSRHYEISQELGMAVDPDESVKRLLEDEIYVPDTPHLHQLTDTFKLIVTSERMSSFNPSQGRLANLFEELKPLWRIKEEPSPKRDRRRKKTNHKGLVYENHQCA